MRQRTVTAMGKIRDNGFIASLQECPTLKQRHEKLAELLPEIRDFPALVKRQLFFHLQCDFQIDLGVCRHYLVDDHAQYCLISGGKMPCSCAIPQGFCISRDKNNQPMYPEFTPCFSLMPPPVLCYK